MKTINGLIACTPLKKFEPVKTKAEGFLSTISQTTDLISTTALFPYDGKTGISKGTVIYLRGNAASTLWGKSLYKLGETTFILVPESEIILIDFVL